MITLPANFVTNVASSTTDLIGTLSPFVTMIIGVLLAGLVISLIIGAIRH